MDSLILQTAIGLVFIFATIAALVSVITESVSRYIGLRAEYLLRGLRTLLDGGGEFRMPFFQTVFGTVTASRKKAVAAKAAANAVPSAAAQVVKAATTVRAAAAAKSHQAAESLEAALGTAGEQSAQQTLKEKTAAATAADLALRAATVAAHSANNDAGSSGPAIVSRVMAHPLVAATANIKVVTAGTSWTPFRRRPTENVVALTAPAGDAPLSNKQRRQLPSYVSARSFSTALIDLLVPDSSGVTTMTKIRTGIASLPADFPTHLKDALLALDDRVTEDVTRFRTNIEHWYDDQMSRVSGWYKRHVRWVSLGIGLVLIIVFNLNVLTIARSLYTDQGVRGSVVTQATSASACGTKTPAQCLQDVRDEIGTIRASGLPLGWTTVPACYSEKTCSWAEQRGFWRPGGSFWRDAGDGGLFLLGWGLMVIALLPGARFWFDILGRLGSLRSTGPKPATTA